MIDEEIRQNAEAYGRAVNNPDFNWEGDDNIAMAAYIAGAHSRDDEIEELKKALAFAEDIVDAQKKKIERLNEPWISVYERLPEKTKALFSCQIKNEEEDKLVLYKDTRGYVHTGYLNAIGHWRDYDRDNSAIYKPTHWRPIPK